MKYFSQMENFYSFAQRSISVIVLVIANLTPIIGVCVFGWRLFPIVLLYWAETGIIALYAVVKVFVIDKIWAFPFVLLFLLFVGLFMTGHYILINGWLNGGTADVTSENLPNFHTLSIISLSLAPLVVSYGVSFVHDFLGKKEYLTTMSDDVMNRVYVRVIILQISILVGAVIAAALESSAVTVLVLIVCCKTVVDLIVYLKMHKTSFQSS